jgi:hypothetical protein
LTPGCGSHSDRSRGRLKAHTQTPCQPSSRR